MLDYLAQISNLEQLTRDGVALVMLSWFMLRAEKILTQLGTKIDRNTTATSLSTIQFSQVEKAREQAQALLDEMKAEKNQ